MKFFKFIFSIKDGEKLIKIFKPDFVNKNRHKYKIIYNNKIYPIQNEFKIPNNKDNKLKIKLICFNYISGVNDIDLEYASLYKFNEIKNYKKNVYKYSEFLNCSYYKMSKLIYRINPTEKEIKIFGKDFVNNNKGKCIIIYDNKIIPLQENISRNDIEKENNKLEITLIELEDISNKSYMFHFCELLEEYSMFDEIENKLKDNEENEEKSLEKEVEKNSNELYENVKNPSTIKYNIISENIVFQ